MLIILLIISCLLLSKNCCPVSRTKTDQALSEFQLIAKELKLWNQKILTVEKLWELKKKEQDWKKIINCRVFTCSSFEMEAIKITSLTQFLLLFHTIVLFVQQMLEQLIITTLQLLTSRKTAVKKLEKGLC